MISTWNRKFQSDLERVDMEFQAFVYYIEYQTMCFKHLVAIWY